MNRIKLSISLLLLLVFSFPLIYQQNHMILYHTDLIEAEHQCEHHHHEASSDVIAIDDYEAYCSIGDFNYTQFDHCDNLNSTEQSYNYKSRGLSATRLNMAVFSGANLSLRAPPVL